MSTYSNKLSTGKKKKKSKKKSEFKKPKNKKQRIYAFVEERILHIITVSKSESSPLRQMNRTDERMYFYLYNYSIKSRSLGQGMFFFITSYENHIYKVSILLKMQ